jgi:hypothetical protein
MRVAIIHDWLITTRGGEKCLEAFCELFPKADVYTLVYAPDRLSSLIKSNVMASGSFAYRLEIPGGNGQGRTKGKVQESLARRSLLTDGRMPCEEFLLMPFEKLLHSSETEHTAPTPSEARLLS